MHTIYHTDAYVFGENPQGESGKSFLLFTRDMGLIYASAAGIRYEKSKLRFSLQKYSSVYVALVYGKTGWRITNAYARESLYHQIGMNLKFELVARIFSLLSRLIQGEEANDELFKILENSVAYLVDNELSNEVLRDVECVLVLRILNNLGYVGDHKDLKFFVLDNFFNNEYIKEINKKRELALGEINRALRESGL